MPLSCRIPTLVAVLLAPSVGIAAESEVAVDFARDVRPIFREHCYSCHGEDKQKSGLRLDNRAAAFKGGEAHRPDIVAGESDQSPLLQLVRSDDADKRMPLEKEPLSAAQIATLTKWIDQGADWPESANDTKLDDPRSHWSFQSLTNAVPPKPKQAEWARGAIDQFVLARLEAEGLPHAPQADRLAWLRRVTFDLTGLPPTPEQVAAFVDVPSASEDDFARVVDELLASPRYAERYAQHWLDVVRYADTHGFEVNTERANAWPYRDYVIEAFQNDTPYDQFIREQLAGDAFEKDAATGFLVTSAVLLPGQIGKDEESKRLARQDELGEIVINTGEAFLGLSVGCARCHDHKFDPISARDYYSMQAFFAGVEYGSRPLHNPEAEAAFAAVVAKRAPVDAELAKFVAPAKGGAERPAVNMRENIERFEAVKAKRVRLVISATCNDNKREPCIDELEVFDTDGNNVALAIHGAVAKASGSRTSANRHELRFVNDGQFGNSRSWMSNEIGKGWVQIELDGEHKIDRISWGRDRQGKIDDRLAVEYRVEIADAGGEWITVADSSDRQTFDGNFKAPPIDVAALDEADRKRAEALLKKKQSLEAELTQYADGTMPIYAGRFKEPEAMFVLYRGDPEQPKDEVVPATPEIFTGLHLDKNATDQQRRLALGEWIADPQHPLTARVMVNRIWQWHFGIGLVDTANDFGKIGTEPTHPELLDWLAAEFIRSGWSVKHLHRLIVLSSTYRQSSRITAEGEAHDADVRMLWRFPARRLEAEAIRDSMLAVSGRLNLKMGGRGYDLFDSRGGTGGFRPLETFDGEGLRRMIYSYKVRMEREAVFGAFDCPDAGQSQPRRSQSTTPIQALNLFNSRFTVEEANAFAKRVATEAGADASKQVERVYRLAFARSPDAAEKSEAEAAVREHGLAMLCRVIYNSSEFLFLP